MNHTDGFITEFTPPEPEFDSAAELREHRLRQVALSYRIFAALGWGTLGDGHITARDPEEPNAMWLLRYDVPFRRAAVSDLVLVGPEGRLLAGEGPVNMTAFYIHAPIHEARPEVVAVAHTHTAYGTPWAARGERLRMICQEATAFYRDHYVFEGEEVQVMDFDAGKRIAHSLQDGKAVILRRHGPVTVGRSVEEAIGWFLLMERAAEVHVKAEGAEPISDAAAATAASEIGHLSNALLAYRHAVMSLIPDPAAAG